MKFSLVGVLGLLPLLVLAENQSLRGKFEGEGSIDTARELSPKYMQYFTIKCYSKSACISCMANNNGNGCGCKGPGTCGPEYDSYVCNKKYKKTRCEDTQQKCSKKIIRSCTKLVKYHAGGYTPGPDKATQKCHDCCKSKCTRSTRDKCKLKCNWAYYYDFRYM